MFVSLGRNLNGVVHDVLMKEVETEEDAFREIRLLLDADDSSEIAAVDIATYDDSCPVFKEIVVSLAVSLRTIDIHFIMRKTSVPMHTSMPDDPYQCRLCALEVALYTKYIEDSSQSPQNSADFVVERR